jgi:hypothetical protein
MLHAIEEARGRAYPARWAVWLINRQGAPPMSRPGHDFYFPVGASVLAQKWRKKPNNFNGAFLSGQAAALPCPGNKFLIISIVSDIAFRGQIINCAREWREPWL